MAGKKKTSPSARAGKQEKGNEAETEGVKETECECCMGPCAAQPVRCYLAGSLLAVIGLLGIAGYFGIADLSPLNWSLLWPIAVLVIGLTEVFGISC